MHPEIQSDKPILCSECGMNLVLAKEQEEEHKEHGRHAPASFLKKFWVSAILSIPVIAYSDIVSDVFKWEAPVFFGSEFLPLVLGSIVFFYGGWGFLVSAKRELQARTPGMMTLIGLAIVTAYLYSIFVVVTGEGKTLFWELTTLIAVMLLGHWIEMRAVQGAQSVLRELSKLLPDTAEVVRGESTETIFFE